MRLCSGPGCLRKIADDVRFCFECQPALAVDDGLRTHTNGYDAELDKLRTHRRWRTLRWRVLSKHPMCCRCDRRVSEIVDHIVPAQVAIIQVQQSGLYPCDPYAGYYLESNLQGLCRNCHGDKTLEDKGHSGPWRDVIAHDQSSKQHVWAF